MSGVCASLPGQGEAKQILNSLSLIEWYDYEYIRTQQYYDDILYTQVYQVQTSIQ